MRLLVITQKVDMNDSNLGFFHVWLQKLAERVDHLYVICLQEGTHTLNKDKVTVLSLGKETGVSKLKYLWRFYKYIWEYQKSYDGVFVHMNPEYAILGGLFWKVWNKKVLLWYTHKSVNLKLRLAEKFVNKIFTASKESFRLPSKKVEVVGHGIPIERFIKDSVLPPTQGLNLFGVGRITPSKDWETVVKAFSELHKGIVIPQVNLDIAGMPITLEDNKYRDRLYAFSTEFAYSGYTYAQMPLNYQRHHLLVHTSQTGSVDKVVLEMLASGRIVVTSSQAYADAVKEGIVYTFPEGDYQELANTIEKIYQSGILSPNNLPNQKAVEYVKKYHNLDDLIGKIINYFTV